jgi:uncharacterized protein
MSSSTPTVDNLFAAAEHRISCYTLTKSSPIPDTRVQEIVHQAVKHAPSSFNVQSTRAVVLVKDEHDKLWTIADDVAQRTHPDAYKGLGKMISGFKQAYGTVLWFEDQDPLDALAKKNPLFGDLVPSWSDVSSGMHQYLVWTALELQGLGCNLQHFNFMPEFAEGVVKEWKLPESWKLKAQLVFGEPVDGKLVRKNPRTYAPLEERVKVFGA